MSLPHSLFLVIFGASGDLTRRKLMPALIKIHNGKRFPEHFAIIGCARTAYTDETYRAYLKEELIKFGFLTKEEMETLDDFLSTVHYQSMDPADETTYFLLNDRLKELSPQYENNGNYLFYLATPPLLYELIPKCLHDAGLLKKPGLKRIIVEKPFGYDLASAQKLNKIYAAYFKEEDIYRIDHFLGKETVQNIMVTRFGSTIYEPIWNRNYIDYVEITAVENMGIGTRGGYYDGAGALRDMVQNHLMQLLAITAMEPPAKFDKNGFRNEVIKVYQSLRPLTDKYIRDNVIRGQYIAGDDRIGYREEKNVRPDSRTDTYVAMCLYVDNWRWQGVPFYIRTGKQMPTKVTEIVVHFKPAPMQMFQMKEGFYKGEELIIRIQPDEGILQRIAMKEPGAGFYMGTMEMDFSYDQHDQETGDASINLDSPFIPRSLVGYATRETMILEFSSAVVALILAGKVGSSIASEIGTMRITEQIDALEIMGVNSASYLILPKIVAAMLFFPFLTILSILIGILGGWIIAAATGIMIPADYVDGLLMDFKPYSITYTLIKTVVFAYIITSISAFYGYNARGNSLEVGAASTRAVVASCVVVLLFDLILTQVLLI